MIRWIAVFMLLAPGAWASCTNAEAHAKLEALSRIVQAKMATKPDETGDIAGEIGDAVSEGVSEALCRKLDALLVRARKL